MKKLGRGMLSALLLIGAPAVAQVHWDMPTAYSGDNFHTQNIKQFARDVDEATNGQFKITVHDSASLYKATEIKRAVQTGQAEIGEIYLANFNNENAIYGLDTIPFVAANYGEARKLNDVAQPVLDKLFAKQRMKLLFSVPWPLNGIYSVKTISSGADLRGMKWRAYNSVSGRMAELLHAQPVTIQAAELSQALATGAVEAFMKAYFLVAKDVGDLTRIFCAALEEQNRKPKPALSRLLPGFLKPHVLNSGSTNFVSITRTIGSPSVVVPSMSRSQSTPPRPDWSLKMSLAGVCSISIVRTSANPGTNGRRMFAANDSLVQRGANRLKHIAWLEMM